MIESFFKHPLMGLLVKNLRVGIDVPTIEVRYEHLNVDAEAYVGGRALPSFFNFGINIIEVTTFKLIQTITALYKSFILLNQNIVLTLYFGHSRVS